MATRKCLVPIVGGPGRWNMMLAVFHGERVCFVFGGSREVQAEITALWKNRPPEQLFEVEISGIFFLDPERTHCSFTTMFPSIKGSKTGVRGEYNLSTKHGTIDLAPLCEIGVFSWPKDS